MIDGFNISEASGMCGWRTDVRGGNGTGSVRPFVLTTLDLEAHYTEEHHGFLSRISS